MKLEEQNRHFADLYQRHQRRLSRFCELSAWDGRGADLLQEVWINIWNSLPRFRAECSLDTWVTRVAVNTALMFRRSEGRRSRQTAKELKIESLADDRSTEQTLRIDTELREKLYACVSQLQPRDRMIVSLHLEALSHREISEVVGVRESHVGVLLHRLKPVLKRCITGDKNEK